MHYDICCVGHITLDKIVTEKATVYMSGGSAFYFSHALSPMDIRYLLVTALAESERHAVKALQDKGIEVECRYAHHTVYFENCYSHNQDHRTQRVLQQAEPFSVEQVSQVKAAIFHLGPLLANDMSLELIKTAAAKGKVSLDVQGFLRRVEDERVVPIDWADKKEALPFIHFLKANEQELEVVTGNSDVYKGAKVLAQWGVKEVIITLGSKGSVVYAEGVFLHDPFFPTGSHY